MRLAASSSRVRLGRAAPFFLAAFVVSISGDSALAIDSSDFEQVYRADFRDQPFDVKTLKLIGPHAADLAKPEREGLRITIPKGLGKPGPIGVVSKFRVRGDFDISGTFEIVKVDKPTEGHGTGVQILVETDTPNKDSATVAWVYQAGKQDRTYTTMQITGPPDDRKYQRLASAPTNARSGTLRIVRQGSTVTTSYQEGPNGPEQIFREIEIGSEEITQVRFAVHTGWTDLPADVRLTSLTIAADELPGYDGAPLSPRGRSPWLLF